MAGNIPIQKVTVRADDRTYTWSRGDDALDLNVLIEFLQGQLTRLVKEASHPLAVLGEDGSAVGVVED